jgi:hypothetical protein
MENNIIGTTLNLQNVNGDTMACIDINGNITASKITAKALSVDAVAAVSIALAGATADIHQFICGSTIVAKVKAGGGIDGTQIHTTAPDINTTAAIHEVPVNHGGDIVVHKCGGNVVGSIDHNGTIITPKVKGNSGTPTSTVGSLGWYMGGPGIFTCGSNDIAGEYSDTPACGCSGSLVTINFSKPYSLPPFISITPSNAWMAGSNFFTTATACGFTVCSTNNVASGVSYKFMYHVIS